jgi:hypothetical protein
MTSFTLFSNVAGKTMGIVPLINQKYEPFPMTPKQKVKAWNSHFSRAMVSTLSHHYDPLPPIAFVRFLYSTPISTIIAGSERPLLTISSGASEYQ